MGFTNLVRPKFQLWNCRTLAHRLLGTIALPFHEPEKRLPTVIVLGFYGSSETQLNRYSKLYNELGHKTLSYILPDPLIFEYDQISQEDITKKLLENLDMEEKVLIHSLSNNGFTLYQHLVKLLSKSNRIQGAILDSCPGPWHFTSNIGPKFADRAFKQDQNVFFPLVAYILLHKLRGDPWSQCFRGAYDVSKKLFPNWKAFSKKHLSPGHHMMYEKETFPLLFLYSKRDRLIPSTFIEGLIDIQISQSRPIFHHDFDTSGHVAHLKSHPEEYKRQVANFISECVAVSKL